MVTDGKRALGVAWLSAGLVFALSAGAQQSIYRCGNKYQTSPCDKEQAGRVVGSTGAPTPEAPKDSRPNAADSPEAQRIKDGLALSDAHRRAQQCLRARENLRRAKAKGLYDGARFAERDLKTYKCARYGRGEKACASAGSQDRAEACKAFMSADPE